MSWEDIMRRVLPPTGVASPRITSTYGATNRPPGSTNPHRGVQQTSGIGKAQPIPIQLRRLTLANTGNICLGSVPMHLAAHRKYACARIVRCAIG